MDNENYTYELEQVLTKLLDFFEPDSHGYVVYDEFEDPLTISEDMARVLDHANDLLYGESIDD